MRTLQPVWIAVGFLAIFALSGAAAFIFLRSNPAPEPATQVATTTVPAFTHRVIGKSVEERDIEAFTYGTGPTHLLLVGGMHGGYEWNSVLLAYQFMDYFQAHPTAVPKNISITIVPDANPDGVYKIIGKAGRFTLADVPKSDDQTAGRFNAHGVDLNRNFDCKWQAKSTWRNKEVSAGSAPFSEPESAAIRDFVLANHPEAVIYWHSQANAVYASECEDGILPETLEIMNAYASAAGYPAVKSFDSYAVTGDTEGWLASIGIPALTVEMSSHDIVEWDKNLAGVQALVQYFSQKTQ